MLVARNNRCSNARVQPLYTVSFQFFLLKKIMCMCIYVRTYVCMYTCVYVCVYDVSAVILAAAIANADTSIQNTDDPRRRPNNPLWSSSPCEETMNDAQLRHYSSIQSYLKYYAHIYRYHAHVSFKCILPSLLWSICISLYSYPFPLNLVFYVLLCFFFFFFLSTTSVHLVGWARPPCAAAPPGVPAALMGVPRVPPPPVLAERRIAV